MTSKKVTDKVTFVIGNLISLGVPLALATGFSFVNLKSLLVTPIQYSGDFLSTAMVTKWFLEGSAYTTQRLGAPFGLDFSPYILPEWLNYFLLATLSSISGSVFFSLNALYFLSFPAAFSASYFVARRIKIPALLSMLLSIAFTLQSFHFLRLGHTNYWNIWVIPIFFYAAILSSRYKH